MTTFGRLALHTWSVDTTDVVTAVAAAREGGFDAVELRRTDFKRCYEKGMSNGAVLDAIRAERMPVCTLGCEYGWLFATGDESKRLFADLKETCANAKALNCTQIMTAPGPFVGPIKDAIENLKRGADLIGDQGLTLAIEFNSQHDGINCIDRLRELISGAGRKNAGMLLDAYHLERSGSGGRGFEGVDPSELAAFQFSDAPPAPVQAGVKRPTDRLLPGQGVVRWLDVFKLLKEKGFMGHLSYEAPNPELWKRPPVELCREAVERTRGLIKKALN